VPLLQSAPNRPDYINILGLGLHSHLFVATCACERVVANIFIALSLLEIACVLVRFDHIASFRRTRESRHHVSGCETSRNRLRC
jgi:hypothetical protein